MKNQRSYLFPILFAASLACLQPALAQSPLAYVTTGGADSGACLITAPCASFGYALSQVALGGEIDVLSDGNFATNTFPYITIGAPVTIDGGGHHVTVTNFGPCTPAAHAPAPAVPGNAQAAICIEAHALDAVSLRNLALNLQAPSSSGFTGYGILNGTSVLLVENVTIDGLFVSITDHLATFAPPNLNVGIYTQSGVTSLRNVRIQNASNGGAGVGVLATGGAFVSVSNSSLIKNDYGLAVQFAAQADVNNCVIYTNSTGVSTSGGAATGGTIRISGSSITNNTLGLQTTGTGASLISFGNNALFGNTVNGNPTGTEALK